jgi:CheY-like chemotaxis protein
MGGLELTHLLPGTPGRQGEHHPHHHRGSAAKLEGLSAGADGYIVKPFDTAELLARVRGVLRRANELRAQSP